MKVTSLKFRGHRCFKSEWVGFDSIKPINVLIGRNNTGKSHLIDLAEALCKQSPYRKGWEYKCTGTPDRLELERAFPRNLSGGALGMGGTHWELHGKHLVGQEIGWTVNGEGSVSAVQFPDPIQNHAFSQAFSQARSA